jgi:CPA1 family monovalent cation:H+ antiporter
VSPWNWLFILAVVGVRGVVSLAVALAIPLTAQNGMLFPYRDLILFVAFGVVATLVVQGLLLPSVVHCLGFLASHAADEHESEHEAELTARAEAPRSAQSRLELAADGDISPKVLAFLGSYFKRHRRHFGGSRIKIGIGCCRA